MLHTWRQQAKRLKVDAYTLYLACRDPRVPWPVRLLAVFVVGYAFSPIDLIPDWIPVIGYLDDLILVPLGITLVVKLIPHQVLQDCRERAQAVMAEGKPVSKAAAAVIIGIWLCGFSLCVIWLWRFLAR